MRKCNLVLAIIITTVFILFTSCEESGSGDDISEATSLGDTLTFSGTVDRTYIPDESSWTTGYSNDTNLDYVLTDESDDYAYFVDDNATVNVDDVNLSYSGEPSGHLISYGGFSSNSSAEFTTIVIEVWDAGASEVADPLSADYTSQDDDIMYGNFSSAPFEMYYYMYSTAETIVSGTHVDTDDDPDTTHVYENVKVFPGWNRMIKSTSDGETFTYTGGEITDPHFTYIDNPEDD